MTWNAAYLKHSPHPTYLGVALDRTENDKSHAEKTKAKIWTSNKL